MKDKKSPVFKILNYGITIATGVLYGLLIIGLLLNGLYTFAILSLAVPAAGVVICSVMRALINAPRPYELNGEGHDNVLGKKTAGKSFPSRHVFCIFIIAVTVLIYDLPYGIVLLCLGVVLAVMRVLAGVHFVRDVVVGAIMGVGLGLVQLIFIANGVS